MERERVIIAVSMTLKNLLSFGSVISGLISAYILLVNNATWQYALEWRPTWLRKLGLWLFESERGYSYLTAVIWLVLGVALQIISTFLP